MRYLLPVGAAIAVTCAVFLGMQHLIADPGGSLAEPSRSPPIEMVRVQRETPPLEKPRALPRRPASAEEPQPPAMALAQPGAPGAALAIAGGMATPKADVEIEAGPALGTAPVDNAAATPMVRVNPTMPRKATVERVGGAVVVRFDIGPTGSTENVRIVDEDPLGYGFGAAATRAVKRWRYRARLVDGQPTVQKDLQIRLAFEHRD